jgi:hypothetical protein
MGDKIQMIDRHLKVPDFPVIPFIEGDGIGKDIMRPSQRVIDAAVAKSYGDARKIVWKEVLAGEKAYLETGEWLPEETINAFREYLVGIKGPIDHACWGRNPFAKCRPAANPRPLCMPETGPLVQRSAITGAFSPFG